ncbi:MAG: hypothetical protein NTV34_05465 [Proteobacteria bacterium]|nr:hypothetical protein [Pseudomonadota bacterium]
MNEEITNRPVFSLRIAASTVLLVSLCWSYGVRDLYLLDSLGFQSSLSKNMLIGLLVVLVAWCYRDFSIEFGAKRWHLQAFAFYVAFIFMSNWSALSEGLACDELYHAGMSSLTVLAAQKVLNQGEPWTWFATRPMPEVVGYFSMLFLVAASVVILVGRCLDRLCVLFAKGRPWGAACRWIFAFLIIVAVGQLVRTFPYRSESHPPLRLMPLFVSQVIFGYDDLSFKIPGVLSLAAVAVLFASLVAESRRRFHCVAPQNLLVALGVGLLVCLIPTVLHAGTIVEPSIWGFVSWSLCFYLLNQFLVTEDTDLLVWAGLTVGVGSLMRQNAIVLWPVIGLVLMWKRPSLMVWVRTLAPGLFLVPFLISIMDGRHAASAGAQLSNSWKALVSLTGFKVILFGTTPPWIIVGLAGIGIVLIQKIWKQVPGLVILFGLIPAFILYFMIWPYLWPIGRYQAEYVGAALGIALLGVGVWLPPKFYRHALILSLLLMAYSWQVMRTLNQDKYYGEWTEKRISTESAYPYREALGFLQRQADGREFAFIGGVPVYGEYHLYMRGFSKVDVERIRTIQGQIEEGFKNIRTASEVVGLAKRIGFRYMVVQYGDKRESQHRAEWQNRMEAIVRGGAGDPGSGVRLQHRFYGNVEGGIDIFEF